MDINVRVLIEPRGFIRIIQLVMSIFAFATTAGFETVATFNVKCSKWNKEVTYRFGYPFKLATATMRVPQECVNNGTDALFKTQSFPFDFSSSAEFFVATGVLTLLYTIVITVFYVFFHRMYSTNPLPPVVDLFATGVLAIFWLSGSSAWAQGVNDVKYYTDPTNFFEDVSICNNKDKTCQTNSSGNFASLNVSLIFGFANFLLWASSLWFIYKETTFHQQQQLQQPMPPQMGQQPPPPMQDQDLGPKIGGQYEY